MSGLLVLNNQQKDGESFQNADIVEVFATPTSPSFLSLKSNFLSATSLATAIPTPRFTVSLTPNQSPSKTVQISSSPSTTIFQFSQSPGAQAGSSIILSPLIISQISISPLPTSTPTPTQLPTVTPSILPTQSPDISPSSTPTSTPELTPIPSETPSNANDGITTVVINEIQVGGVDAGDEFIELHNPTNLEIDISSWSIQYLTGSTNDITKTVKKNFEAGNKIPALGFFLIARAKNSSDADGYTGNVAPDLDHRSFSLSGASTGGKIFLVNDAVKIDSLTDANIVDSIDYSFLVPENGRSLERKSDGNFELNNSPNPQNTNQ